LRVFLFLGDYLKSSLSKDNKKDFGKIETHRGSFLLNPLSTGVLQKMFFIKIFKKETRRSREDRKKSINPKCLEYIESEKRNFQDRRSNKDRRSDFGRRSGIYYKLSDNQKDTIDTIIDILEAEGMKKK
jgi:hypothetical protein